MSINIRISNPAHGGTAFIGLKRAERYVRAGRATWNVARTVITFHQNHPSNVAVLESALGYDKIRNRMTMKQLRGIPVLMPQKALWL